MIQIIDLHFLSFDHAIASFLIPSEDGPILIETGPHSTFDHLSDGLNKLGYAPEDIKHVLLTHIHFDHAGAAWALAEKGAKIYVHPYGAPHLASPQKLYDSAKMIYGDDMDRLWGQMKNIPQEQIHETLDKEVLEIGGINIEALHTPGHAKHHIAWKLDDTIFTGDVAGVMIENGPVVPPCPPPDINLEDWLQSIDTILQHNPKRLYLTHYGPVEGVEAHMTELKSMLTDWSEYILNAWKSGMSADEITPQFSAYTKQQLLDKGVSEVGTKQYEAANPSWMSVAGLIRYWKKKGV